MTLDTNQVDTLDYRHLAECKDKDCPYCNDRPTDTDKAIATLADNIAPKPHANG